jgi:hypothetical protein
MRSKGCYICQPDNPDAAEEGCGRCDADFLAHAIAVVAADPADTGR